MLTSNFYFRLVVNIASKRLVVNNNINTSLKKILKYVNVCLVSI